MPTKDEVKFWFTHSEKQDPEKSAKFVKLHDDARELALKLVDLLPDRPESVLALNALQEMVTWGNTAISRS